MEYVEQVLHTFSPNGVLAKHNQQYQPRAGQQKMAEAVARTVANGGVLVAEAGTGTGKTFAYLVPALLSGKRVMVSTATKALQDQLFHRDIPHVLESLALPAKVALLKGRSSYLCTHRMQLARHEALTKVQLKVLSRVEKWAQSTSSGDLDELTDGQELQPMRHWISSNRDNCLGQDCADFKTCHVNIARRNALAADVVVVNHHLFFADQSVRASGMAELLPSVHVCIFDEAHQINEVGIQFLGMQLSSRQVVDFSRDVLAAGFQHARGLEDWQQLCSDLERAMQDVRLVASPKPYEQRLRWHGHAPEDVPEAAWDKALGALSDALEEMYVVLEQGEDVSPDFKRLKERCEEHLDTLNAFLVPPNGPPKKQVEAHFNGQATEPLNAEVVNGKAQEQHNWVRWVETGKHLRLVQAPLDIAKHMRGLLRLRPDSAATNAIGDGEEAAEEAAEEATEKTTEEAHEQEAQNTAGDTDNRSNPNSSESKDASSQAHKGGTTGKGGKSWVFTSATLGYGGNMRWFTHPCGLFVPQTTEQSPAEKTAEEATDASSTQAPKDAGWQDGFPNIEVLEVASPFAYQQQACVYVPPTFPEPNTPEHSPSVAKLAEAAARRIGGRTMVLTTTTRAMHTIADALKESLEDADDLGVMVQGEASKHELLERFHAAAGEKAEEKTGETTEASKGMILVATASFWEGIDIPGAALELVLIDKLPFPPPSDPMVEARCQRIESKGGRAFAQYSLPEAAVALKQGAGRLIRTESDQGVLVLCDVRLLHKGYGRQLLSALPPMRRLHHKGEFSQALHALNANR